MKKHVADEDGKIVEVVEDAPVCGQDLCDDCGDCLACYGDDPCAASLEGHRWVVYGLRSISGGGG